MSVLDSLWNSQDDCRRWVKVISLDHNDRLYNGYDMEPLIGLIGIVAHVWQTAEQVSVEGLPHPYIRHLASWRFHIKDVEETTEEEWLQQELLRKLLE